MRRRPIALPVLLILIASAGCERTPGDPLDADTAALGLEPGARAGAHTLSGLVYSSIRGVYNEQGSAAARVLVQNLAQLQHDLERAPAGERAALSRRLREEQLRIVLLARGNAVVGTTIDGVLAEAVRLRQRRDALTATGIAAPEVSAALDELPALISQARRASSEIEALDAATRAAAMTERVRAAVAGAARLPSLTELFEDAVVRVADSSLAAGAHARRNAARAAVRAGDRRRAEAAVKAAREAEIDVVLSALGPDAVADMIGWARDRALEQKQKLIEAGASRDVSRLQRMNLSAADMLERAGLRLRNGESPAALDLAAHAVDLLNAIEATLTAF